MSISDQEQALWDLKEKLKKNERKRLKDQQERNERETTELREQVKRLQNQTSQLISKQQRMANKQSLKDFIAFHHKMATDLKQTLNVQIEKRINDLVNQISEG